MAGASLEPILGWHPEQIKDRPDYVYFIENTQAGLIKIGRSWKPELRLQQIARDVLKVRGLIQVSGSQNSASLEKHLHRYFAETRIEGEWFLESAALNDLIKAVKEGGFRG